MTTPTPSPDSPESRALATLSLLQLRLQRLEFLLTGLNDISANTNTTTAPDHSKQTTTDTSPQSTQTIPSQLASLESQLTALKRLEGLGGSLVRAVDDLHTRLPEIFPTSEQLHSTTVLGATTHISDTDPAAPRPSTQQLSQLATEVLANAPLYTTTTSQLQTLQHIPVPPAEASAELIQQADRLKGLMERLERVEVESRELKERSARVMEWWVKFGVVGWGEVMEGWEGRVTRAGWVVRGFERVRNEEGVVA